MVVKDNPKILIAVPCLYLLGGVSNYYEILRPYLGADKEYFEIGSRPGEKSIISSLRRLISGFAFKEYLWDQRAKTIIKSMRSAEK